MRRMMLAQGFGGIADFALAGQEHQHIAGADAAQFIDRIGVIREFWFRVAQLPST